ncbi:hypothetical protein F4561_000609 [Lipingzhangella halophila]|uniref:DUF8129 domain-containing protein n=1 Tax=Lipingzhangella halophila TaxID=1783352 RepID=A0A7W7W1J1_9ACTN|nr:hypothetical protein [Lipingzhangella halophila]MBB4929789.1 hypothetical protein [Lipingzhangella halophila]
MSNPSIASKLMTLVKGVIGPKKPATVTSSASATAEDTPTEAEQQPEEAKAATTTEKPADATTGEAESDGAADSAESTDSLDTEEKSTIAEELAVAEANTQVASDEVFDQVRQSTAPSAEDLAVPGYDDLTLPSIRARLRKLTMEQVRELRAYEVANQGRQEFIRMYDNRIAKLQSEDQ